MKISQKRLREIAWQIGKHYPIPLSPDYIALSMVSPHLGQVHWHVDEALIQTTGGREEIPPSRPPLIVRVYDVTDILFDGTNAHGFIDLEVNRLAGKHYFSPPRLGRHYLAEIGRHFDDGAFYPFARSNTVFFEHDRPTGNYQTGSLFVGGALQRTFPVENVFDAPVYERMNQALAEMDKPEALSVALVLVGIDRETGPESTLADSVQKFSRRVSQFGGHARLFTPCLDESLSPQDEHWLNGLTRLSQTLVRDLNAAHRKKPFSILHCHDWYSAVVGLPAAKQLHLPLILSLHSTEYERTHGYERNRLSAAICKQEKAAVEAAHLVITPHSSTRQQVINLYGAAPDKVVIIPDVFTEHAEAPFDSNRVKREFEMPPDAPLVLFAGEISHAAGADLLLEAATHVCRKHDTVQFLLAGDGPLKGELEARAHHGGIGHRCRFVGDVSSETFESLLAVADFVAIPARTWQDEGLAQLAVEYGKPVLTTHQTGIHCIVHGQNGLLTYDNPGSIIWGIQELLANPMQGSMQRLLAKKKANSGVSLDNIAAQHYLYYAIIFKHRQEGTHG